MRKPGDLVMKDPNSDEPHGFDWTLWLAELGASVVVNTSTWVITGTDALLTSHDPTIVAGSLKTQVYLAAGTVGKKYTVTNRVTTNSAPPVTDERSFYVFVQDQ
jgi:UDP-N-acetylglucosamine enolpyruvyl transferase